MPWSFGLFVLLACFAVKLLFKRGRGSGWSGRSAAEDGARDVAGWSPCELR